MHRISRVRRAYDSNTHFMKYNNKAAFERGGGGHRARYLNNNADIDRATHRQIKPKIGFAVPIALKSYRLGWSDTIESFFAVRI